MSSGFRIRDSHRRRNTSHSTSNRATIILLLSYERVLKRNILNSQTIA